MQGDEVPPAALWWKHGMSISTCWSASRRNLCAVLLRIQTYASFPAMFCTTVRAPSILHHPASYRSLKAVIDEAHSLRLALACFAYPLIDIRLQTIGVTTSGRTKAYHHLASQCSPAKIMVIRMQYRPRTCVTIASTERGVIELMEWLPSIESTAMNHVSNETSPSSSIAAGNPLIHFKPTFHPQRTKDRAIIKCATSLVLPEELLSDSTLARGQGTKGISADPQSRR